MRKICGDRRRYLQFLLNFISNSLKFTQEGGTIKVKIVILEIQDNESSLIEQTMGSQKHVKLCIIVEDNGMGIKKENLSKLFKDYNKLDEHKNVNAKGTGLGLSICKKIINQMGGDVHPESELGEGTRFLTTIFVRAIDLENETDLDLRNNFCLIHATLIIP